MNKKRHLSLRRVGAALSSSKGAAHSTYSVAIYLPIAIVVVVLGIFLVLNQDNGHVPQAVSTSAPTDTLTPPTATAIPTSTVTKTPELLQGSTETPFPQSVEVQTSYPPPRPPESGEAFRFENAASATFSGMTYRISRLLIAKSEVLPPEYYAYSPLLAGKQTILYVKLEVSNAGGKRASAPAAGVLILGDGTRALDAFRLRDYIQAGTALPHIRSDYLSPGEGYVIGFWLGTDAAPNEIRELKLVLDCPSESGKAECLGEIGRPRRDVILNASLRNGKPLEPDVYGKVSADSRLGTYSTISGLQVEIARLLLAPREAVPEIAEYMSADIKTVAHLVYRITNTTSEPLNLYSLESAGVYWRWMPGMEPGVTFLEEFYAAGLSLGREMADRRVMPPIQPAETIVTGIWFGLPAPMSKITSTLLIAGGRVTPAGVELSPETVSPESIHRETSKPWGYQPYPALFPAQTAIEVALPESEICQAGQAQIQAALQAAIPPDRWGLKYQTNGASPPEMKFLGVTSGEVGTLIVPARQPFVNDILDLTRLYYLRTDGSLGELWTALGMTRQVLGNPGSYSNFNNTTQSWRSSQEAQAIFSQPGQVYTVVISDWYAKPDGVHWEHCYEKGRYTFSFVCDTGLMLDGGMSAQFFATGEPSEGWLAFNWGIYPLPNSDPAGLALPGLSEACQ